MRYAGERQVDRKLGIQEGKKIQRHRVVGIDIDGNRKMSEGFRETGKKIEGDAVMAKDGEIWDTWILIFLLFRFDLDIGMREDRETET